MYMKKTGGKSGSSNRYIKRNRLKLTFETASSFSANQKSEQTLSNPAYSGEEGRNMS
jgi:hypothetical protein